MSVPVGIVDLEERLEEYGRIAFLTTVGTGGGPHVVSVVVELADGALVAGAGRTTAANVTAHPEVTLLWPATGGSDYCLIVDGCGRIADGAEQHVVIEPSRAVLHRLASADGPGPSCITVLDRRQTPPTA